MMYDKTLTVSELIKLLTPYSGDIEVVCVTEAGSVTEGITGILSVDNSRLELDTTGNVKLDETNDLANKPYDPYELYRKYSTLMPKPIIPQ